MRVIDFCDWFIIRVNIVTEGFFFIVRRRKMKNYDFVSDFDIGFARRVELAGKNGFINEKGEEICPIKYDWVREYSTGFARHVELDGKKFKIDENGNEIKVKK